MMDFRLPNQPPILSLMGHALHSKNIFRTVRQGLLKNEGIKCWFCGAEETFRIVQMRNGIRYEQSELSAHEVFEFDDIALTRKIKGIHLACPNCHLCAHIVYPKVKSDKALLEHFCRINNCSESEATTHLLDSFKKWQWRNKRDWLNCLSWVGHCQSIR
jgi:hypothetical protein